MFQTGIVWSLSSGTPFARMRSFICGPRSTVKAARR
ncbi:hypothetical protein GGP43_003166 [Salinibacter ruber]|nr:hypothetical protein [Salinibacter ruber]